jgi:hypothetical protein
MFATVSESFCHSAKNFCLLPAGRKKKQREIEEDRTPEKSPALPEPVNNPGDQGTFTLRVITWTCHLVAPV